MRVAVLASGISLVLACGGGPPRQSREAAGAEQAVLVYLDGANLPSELYETYDLSTLEGQLRDIVTDKQLGEYDGNEFRQTETVLYLYGPDADRLFAGIERVLRDYPLCQGARVVIRAGPPGAPQRELRL